MQNALRHVIYNSHLTISSIINTTIYFVVVRNEDGTVTFNKNNGKKHTKDIYKTNKSNRQLAEEIHMIMEDFKDRLNQKWWISRLFLIPTAGMKLESRIDSLFDELIE